MRLMHKNCVPAFNIKSKCQFGSKWPLCKMVYTTLLRQHVIGNVIGKSQNAQHVEPWGHHVQQKAEVAVVAGSYTTLYISGGQKTISKCMSNLEIDEAAKKLTRITKTDQMTKNVTWTDECLLKHTEGGVKNLGPTWIHWLPTWLVTTVLAGAGGVRVWGIILIIMLIPINHPLNETACEYCCWPLKICSSPHLMASSSMIKHHVTKQ